MRFQPNPSDAARRHQPRRKACSVINPRSEFVNVWGLLTSVALIITATVTPYEAAFFPVDVFTSDTTQPGLYWMNRVLDVYFVADFALAFFFALPADANSLSSVIPALQDNARRYACSWLALDLIASIPFDFLVLLALQYGSSSGGSSSAGENGSGSAGRGVEGDSDLVNYQQLNLLGALRMLKLLRLSRLSSVFMRLRDAFGLNYRVASLAAWTAILLWSCHLFACAWKLVSDLQPAENSARTWLFLKGLKNSDHFEQCVTVLALSRERRRNGAGVGPGNGVATPALAFRDVAVVTR
jgi:hypothetical protein